MLLLLHAISTLRDLPCIKTLVEQAVRLKRLRTAAFESSEPLFLGLMAVSVPSLHRESTDSLIYHQCT